jgi:hypothetical protein
LLGRLDRVDKNRSALLERAALAYLNQLERQGDRNDVEIIDRNAERLNREAMDTLEYSNSGIPLPHGHGSERGPLSES